MEKWQKKIETLEFHQQLLLTMVTDTPFKLYHLIIKKNLTKEETERLLQLCDSLSVKLQKQKAEGFVTFYPLLTELKANLQPTISCKELVESCLEQGIHKELMQTLIPLIED